MTNRFRRLAMVLSVALCSGVSNLVTGADAVELSYYLPEGVSYDSRIPLPQATLGFEVGEWHVRHDQLVQYMQTLAAVSDRVSIQETGRTYEHRPLLLLTITSPANLQRIEEIQAAHRKLSEPGSDIDLAELPIVVYLGYSVHGNESSGSNAALAVAYHLAAAQGAEVDSLLANTVILLDPSLNPDGLSRFSHWANTHRGKNLVGDPAHREHREGWPSGRTNHYWFDLNRDWLLLQHPESRARVAQFHRWKPNVLTDFHEMGSNSTYFFQPGVSSRRNPLTPERNVELTAAIATYHARAFDQAGVLYYTEENFDDFYYGKGSTYPDVNGGIGILFEQASSRGHLRDSVNGEFDFPFTIRNQCLTSFSTLRGALDNRRALLQWQKDFYDSAAEAGRAEGIEAWVFGSAQSRHRNAQLLSILLQHDIQVYALASAQKLSPTTQQGSDVSFEPGSAWVVPTQQAQGRLLRALFETRTSFVDSLFYDVSTWTLPLALNVPFASVQRLSSSWLGDAVTDAAPAPGAFETSATVYAYAFEWNEYLAPHALQRLHKLELRPRVATDSFSAQTPARVVEFQRGTIVVPVGSQRVSREELRDIMQTIAQEDGIDVHALTSGFTPQGIDLGSPSLRPLQPILPAIVVGSGVSSYEVGEAWHLLDQRMNVPVSLLEMSRLGATDLSAYTHLILVNGNYARLGESAIEAMQRWVRSGGVLMAQKAAVRWARDKGFADVTFLDDKEDRDKKKRKKKSNQPQQDQDKMTQRQIAQAKEKAKQNRVMPRRDYAEHERTEGAHIISGAIFQVDLDVTHPLGYGFSNRRLPVFRNSRLFMKPHDNPYSTVAQYDKQPLLSGWISSRNLKKLPGTASLVATSMGDGAVILFVDNPNFRGFWYGTNKLFLNALFFGQIIESTDTID